jgi:hypothetical protein
MMERAMQVEVTEAIILAVTWKHGENYKYFSKDNQSLAGI